MIITDGNQLSGSAMPRIVANSQALLVGRTIKKVGYYQDDFGAVWPCLVLDNGTTVTASKDDEGNGPGSLFVDSTVCHEILCRTSAK